MWTIRFLRDKTSKKNDPLYTDQLSANWKPASEIIRQLGIAGYKPKYSDTCREIWQTKVPDSGQANTLQAEMLRQAEKIRNEACDNGNINWNSDFSWFCDFLREIFEKSRFLEQSDINKLRTILITLKKAGEYAAAFAAGEIDETNIDIERIAYCDSDLYDYVEDAIALYARNHPKDIPYKKKSFIYL